MRQEGLVLTSIGYQMIEINFSKSIRENLRRSFEIGVVAVTANLIIRHIFRAVRCRIVSVNIFRLFFVPRWFMRIKKQIRNVFDVEKIEG